MIKKIVLLLLVVTLVFAVAGTAFADQPPG